MQLSKTILFFLPFAAGAAVAPPGEDLVTRSPSVVKRGNICIDNSVVVPCSCSANLFYNSQWKTLAGFLNRFRTIIRFEGVDQQGNNMTESFFSDRSSFREGIDACDSMYNIQVYQNTDYTGSPWVMDWSYPLGSGHYTDCINAVSKEWQTKYGCDDGSLEGYFQHPDQNN